MGTQDTVKLPLTKERWENILRCKKEFIAGSQIDPRQCPYMDPNVAESWIRSRKMGINYSLKASEAKKKSYTLTPDGYEQILKENEVLIELAKPVFQAFAFFSWTQNAPYSLSLLNPDSVLLLDQGLNKSNSMVRAHLEMDMKEEYCGTNAFALARILKKPVQLIGVEHYIAELENDVMTAAPIFNDKNELIAVLQLGQPCPARPWEEAFQINCSHTLTYVTTLAEYLENKLKLYHSKSALEKSIKELHYTNNLLNTTLSLVDEGILCIDHQGKIVNINDAGKKILNYDDSSSTNRNITEFVKNPTLIMSIIGKGRAVDIEELICTGSEEQYHLINIRPFKDPKTKTFAGAVLRLNNIEKVNKQATKRVGTKASFTFESLIGKSNSFRQAVNYAKNLASLNENILLIGESGTGKELFAQAIHNAYRPYGPFIAVNCAALPRELIESELFGYEGGSFTGADRSGRPGKIELAHNGTLFLDEIGDMPLELQPVLLRTLENKTVMRIGSSYARKVDFRLIAATNKDLKKMVEENRFREDLYYRLSVLKIKIPPLRNREDDIELLCQHFLKSYCKKINRSVPKISPKTMQILKNYNWPGNVRQLENAIIYSVNISQGDTIEPEHLPDDIFADKQLSNDIFPSHQKNIDVIAPKKSKMMSLKEMERYTIESTLIQCNYNISQTARILDISKSTLYRKMKEFGIPYNTI